MYEYEYQQVRMGEMLPQGITKCDRYIERWSIEQGSINMIQQDRQCVRIFKSLLLSNQFILGTKATIFKATVEPISIYGAECWLLSFRK